MVKKRMWRLVHVWIACFAILMNALAPSISHALAMSRGQTGAWEICSADPARKDALRASVMAAQLAGYAPEALFDVSKNFLDTQQDAKIKAGQHCGYCMAHAGSVAILPPATAGFALASARQRYPFLFYRSPQPLTVWSAARPRGPPVPA